MTYHDTSLELEIAEQLGCMTRRVFNTAGYTEGWVVFVDTLNKRFVAKQSTNPYCYWRNFLYCFEPSSKRATVVQCLQDMAAQVPRDYWVGLFTPHMPDFERIRRQGYVQCVAKHKGYRERTVDSRLFEYRHRNTGMVFFIAVAHHVRQKDVYRRLIARIQAVERATDLPARVMDVRARISEDAGKCLMSACLVHAGANLSEHFEVIERADLKGQLMEDKNSGSGLVRALNLNALVSFAKQVRTQRA